MSAGVIAAVALGGALGAWVVLPLLRRGSASQAEASERADEVLDLHSRREMALAALRDLEDDQATGKIGEADYRSLRDRFTRQAVAILKRLDELEAKATAKKP